MAPFRKVRTGRTMSTGLKPTPNWPGFETASTAAHHSEARTGLKTRQSLWAWNPHCVLAADPDKIECPLFLFLFSVSLSLDPLTADPELVGREIRNHLDAAGVRERHCIVAVPLKWALILDFFRQRLIGR